MGEESPDVRDSRYYDTLWALSNFFLQLFIWGLPTGLFLFWTATLWEGFVYLAFITAIFGITWAVAPLWAILYPRSVQKRPFQWPDWVKGGVVFLGIALVITVPLLLLVIWPRG